MPRPMPLVRPIVALLAAVLVAGCGGAGPTVEARDQRVEIELDDFLIRPQNVRAQAGELTFAVGNRGRLGHNLRLQGGAEGEQVVTTTLLPGDGATKPVTLTPGAYTMLCTVANHEQLGMTGRLVVR
jgi:plastocyanin